MRASGASRYRQWITHKLSTWHDQFGGSGCVGCGRCIAWCPVGIDITEEAGKLAQDLACAARQAAIPRRAAMTGAEQATPTRWPVRAVRPAQPGAAGQGRGTARQVSYPRATRLFDEGQAANGCWLIRDRPGGSRVRRCPAAARSSCRRSARATCWAGPGWSRRTTGISPRPPISPVSAPSQLDTARLRALADGDPALGYPLLLGLLEAVAVPAAEHPVRGCSTCTGAPVTR